MQAKLFNTAIVFILLLFVSTNLSAASYTWAGATSSWTATATNWSPSGIPTTGDNVTINAGGTYTVSLTGNTTIANLTVSGTYAVLDLGGYTLTVTGTATFTSGIINNGTLNISNGSATTTFSGTTFGANLTVTSANIIFSGSVFNGTLIADKTGTGTSTGNGGNVFNAAVTLIKSGSGAFTLSNNSSLPDTFNSTLHVIQCTSGNLNIAHQGVGNVFNDEVTFSSRGGGNIHCNYYGTSTFNDAIIIDSLACNLFFGFGSGRCTQTAGHRILAGANGFSAGTAHFRGFTQNGTTDTVNLNVTGTGKMYFEAGSVWNSPIIESIPAVGWTGARFNAPVTFIQTLGSGGSGGGSYFAASAILKNATSGTFSFTVGNAAAQDTFASDAFLELVNYRFYLNGALFLGNTTLKSDVPGLGFHASNNGDVVFRGNVTLIGSGGTFDFGFAAGTTLLDNGAKLILDSPFSGNITLEHFTQVGPDTINFTGTARLALASDNAFDAPFIYSGANFWSNGTTFNNSVNVTRRLASSPNISDGGNVFNGVVTITDSSVSARHLIFANLYPDTFNAAVTFIEKGSISTFIQPAYGANSVFKGNVTVQGTAAVPFGANGGKVIFAGGANQTLNKTGSFGPTFKKVEVNKSAGTVKLNFPLTLGTDSLILTKGVLLTDASNLLTFPLSGKVNNGSDSAYICGPVKKAGNDAGFTFPLGDTALHTYAWHPVTISQPSSTGVSFTAQYITGDHGHGTNAEPTIEQASTCEYWDVSRSGGSAADSVNITLNWNHSCNSITPADMRVAYWDVTPTPDVWTNKGNGAYTGSSTVGSVTSQYKQSSFGHFALADKVCTTVSVSATTTATTCYGGSNGRATATATLGTLPYTYSWTTGATTATITGLSANTYTATVTDVHGCTTTITATVTQPSAFSASIIAQSSVSCHGGSNGTATASSNGTSPFIYAWSSGATTATASSLYSGTYSVIVTDVNGCTASTSTTITQPNALIATASNSSPVCEYSDVTLSSSVSGGTSPYTYSWSAPNGFTSSSSGLVKPAYLYPYFDGQYFESDAGYYHLLVFDHNGCLSVDDSTNVIIYARPMGNPYVDGLNSSVAICRGSSSTIELYTLGTGTITGTFTNGITFSGEQYLIEIPVSPTTSTNYRLTYLTDEYCETFTSMYDAGNSVTINVTDLSLSPSTTAVTCYGSNNGTASISPNGGTSPYTYSWSSGATTSAISGLSAATYSVMVTDHSGCTSGTDAVVGVTHTLDLSTTFTPVAETGASNGSAIANASGTPPYTYSWSTSATTTSITGLAEGTYSITAIDANGCSKTNNITIDVISSPLASELNYFAVLAGDSIKANNPVFVYGKAGAYHAIDMTISTNDSILQSNSGTVPNALAALQTSISAIVAHSGSTISGILDGQSLSRGYYKVSGDAILSDTLTLTGDTSDIYIFDISGKLTVDSFAYVNRGNVVPANIYWHTGSDMLFQKNISLSGVLMAEGNITSYINNYGHVVMLAQGDVNINDNTNNSNLQCFSYSALETGPWPTVDILPIPIPLFPCATCTIETCNLLYNPGFEDGFIPKSPGGVTAGFVCCWRADNSSLGCGTIKTNTVDLFDKNAAGSTNPSSYTQTPGNTCNEGPYVGIPYNFTSDNIDVRPGSTGHRYIAVLGNEEKTSGMLTTKLSFNKSYYLSFWSQPSTCYNSGFGSPRICVNLIDNNGGFLPIYDDFIPNPSSWHKYDACFQPNLWVSNQTQLDNYTRILVGVVGGDRVLFDDFTLTKLNDDEPDKFVCNSSVQLGPECPISDLNITYTWAPADGLSCTTCPNPTALPSKTTTYTLTIDVGNSQGCTVYDEVTIYTTPELEVDTFLRCDADNSQDYNIKLFDPGATYSFTCVGGTITYPTLVSGQVNVFWNNLSVGGSITMTYSKNGCTKSKIFNFQPCCNFAPPVANYHNFIDGGTATEVDKNNDKFVDSSPTDYYTADWVINRQFVVSHDLIIQNKNIYLASGAWIEVDPGVILTLSNCTLQAGCGNMWRGIKVMSGAIVDMNNNCRIYDAENAIIALNGSSVYLSNTSFEKNYNCIKIPENGAIRNTIPGFFIMNTTFSGKTNLINPFLGQLEYDAVYKRANAGIVAYNVANLPVTNAASIYNIVFDNLNYGIFAKGSKIAVANAKFQNMDAKHSPVNIHSGSGIYCSGSPSFASSLTANSLSYTCLFQNCVKGIYCDQSQANIMYTDMLNVRTGITIINANSTISPWPPPASSPGSAINVESNNINTESAGGAGIYCASNNRAWISINTNFINTGNNGSQDGIKVLETNLFASTYSATNNIITLSCSGNGIFLNNVRGDFNQRGFSQIVQNKVNLNTVNTRGIYVPGGSANQFLCNSLVTSASIPLYFTNSTGMLINNSRDNFYGCNHTNQTQKGVTFFGNCKSDNRFFTTEFNTHNWGLDFENIAMIGPQTDVGDNWLYANYIPNYGVFGGPSFNPSFSKIFYKNCGTPNYTTNQNFIGQIFFPSATCPSTCSSFGCTTPSRPPQALNFIDSAVVADTIFFPEEYSAAMKWEMKNALYHKLESDTTWSSDSLFINFYDSAQAGSIGAFAAIEDSIQVLVESETAGASLFADNDSLIRLCIDSIVFNDSLISITDTSDVLTIDSLQQLNLALSASITALSILKDSVLNALEQVRATKIAAAIVMNEAITVSGIYEQNIKAVNDIYFKTAAIGKFDFTSGQSDTLYDIASQCPNIGGQAVFSARSLYVFINDSIDFADDSLCIPDYNGVDTCNAPDNAGPISGLTNSVCNKDSVVYAIDVVSGATGYNWWFSDTSNVTIIGADTLNSIMLSFTGLDSVTIYVAARNACGSSAPQQFDIYGNPKFPETLNNPLAVCCSDTLLFAFPDSSIINLRATMSGYIGDSTFNDFYEIDVAVEDSEMTAPLYSESHEVVYDCDNNAYMEVDIATSLNPNFIRVIVCGNISEDTLQVWASNLCGTDSLFLVLSDTCYAGDSCGGDEESRKSYSAIMPDKKDEFKVYPNPTTGLLNIEYISADDKTYSLTVTDVIGNVLVNKDVDIRKDSNLYQLDLNWLAKGMYFIVLRSTGTTQMQRIMIYR